jgi:hypothetical protein
MSEGKVLTTSEKLQVIVNRFRAEHVDNLRKGVTGPDLVRHVAADVEALHELAAEVEMLYREHVAMGVSLLNANARIAELTELLPALTTPADVETSAPPTKKGR